MRNTKGVGVLIIDVIALSAIDPDCNGATNATVSWTDLGGEYYQLERSTNAVTWSIIYTGMATTKLETLPNADQIYYYRVRLLSDDVYSNIDSFEIYQQDKFLRDVGCHPDFDVAPYYFRKAYRQNCGERYVDTIDEETCKDDEVGTGTEIHWTQRIYRFAGDPSWECIERTATVRMRDGYVVTGKVGDFIPANIVWTCDGNNTATASCQGDYGDYFIFIGSFSPGGCRIEVTITGHTIT